MKLTLPLPVSKNAAYTERAVAKKDVLIDAVKSVMREERGAWKDVLRALTVVRHRSEAYMEYLKEVKRWVAAQDTSLIEGDVMVDVVVFFPDRRIDLPNVVDVFFDALQGICYVTDGQVADLRFRREIDKDNPRCVAVIRGLNHDLFAAPESESEFTFDLEF